MVGLHKPPRNDHLPPEATFEFSRSIFAHRFSCTAKVEFPRASSYTFPKQLPDQPFIGM